MREITRRATSVVADLERFLAGGEPTLITKSHGWPDLDAIKSNLDALRRLGDLPVTFKAGDNPTGSKEDAVSTPTPTPPLARPVAEQAPDTIANLLAAAHQHDKPVIRKLAERIDGLLARLRADIKADREDAERRAKIRELEEQLAKLKGAKSTTGKAKRTLTKGEFPCPVDGCDSVFDTKQGVTMHNTRTHRDAA